MIQNSLALRKNTHRSHAHLDTLDFDFISIFYSVHEHEKLGGAFTLLELSNI